MTSVPLGPDTTALRALAEAATPGPWEARNSPDDPDDGDLWCVYDVAGELVSKWTGRPLPLAVCYDGPDAEPDARYLAAVSPDVVLGLLDALDQARAAASRWEDDAHCLAEAIRSWTGWGSDDIPAALSAHYELVAAHSALAAPEGTPQ